MITISTDGFIVLDTLQLNEAYEVFHNCESVLTGTTDAINTTVTTTLTATNGVYQVVTPTTTYNYFYYDNVCPLFEKFNKELYYLWVALKLGEQCPDQYSKLCTVYEEFANELNNICNGCL